MFSFPLFKRAAGLQLRQSTSRRKAMDPIPLRYNFAQGRPRTSVIMSKEALGELVAEGRIIRASAVDLAQVQLGVAVRAGAPKPDIYFDLPNRTVQRKKLTAGSHRGEPYGRAHAVRQDLVV
jgi:hypothetical protein